jgi:peptidoglycan/xylan/chitin deacetylase (PgdA/CDA1 family)
MNLARKLHSVFTRIWPAKPMPLILMYHRIANDPIDNWDLAVSPDNFEQQLDVLRRTRRPLPLADFVSNLISGTLPSDAVAVTFDDGYVDNLLDGKPRLDAADVPATVFLATGYSNRPFWWDELSRLVLTGQGRKKFELVVNGKSMDVDLGIDAVAKDGVIPAVTLNARKAVLATIWEALRLADDTERQRAITQLGSIIVNRNDVEDGPRGMTSEEVRELVSDGLVTIGAHTVTHPLLRTLSDFALNYEIAESKLHCEALVDREVNGFSYPHGDFNVDVQKAVSASGFDFACSTRHGPVRMNSDLLALPRVQICNWDGDEFQRALHRW